MATYTPLQPGQPAALGTSGQAVADLQTQLNKQNAGKAGYVPLAVDSKYGPLTQAATTFKPASQLIVTGSKPAANFAKNQQDLTTMINTRATSSTPPGWDPTTYANFKKANPTLEPDAEDTAKMNGSNSGGTTSDPNSANFSDPYTQALDRLAASSDKATQNLIATIKNNKTIQANTINDQYDRLKAGLFSLGLSTDKLQFTPELVYGQQIQTENARAAKLQDLDTKEATAISDAQLASDNKDFTTLKEKMAYIKDLKNQKLDVLKNTAATLTAEQTIGKIQAAKIYDQLQKLPEDQKIPFLTEIAKRSGIDLLTLTSQVNALAKKGTTATGSVTKNKNLAITNINSILNNKEKDASGYSVRGQDNYVDPSVYLDMFSQWQKAGFSDKEFFTKFDPKIYINPASYNELPEAFRPKKAGRSS